MKFFSIFKKKQLVNNTNEESKKGKEYSDDRKNELNLKLTKGGLEELERLKEKDRQTQESKKAILVNNLEDLKINLNKDQREVLVKLKQEYPKFLSTKIVSRKFLDKKEIQDYARERIISFLNEMHLELALRISRLRKKGQKISYINLKVMYVSSKLRLFKQEMNLKELNNLLKNFKFAELELEKFKDIENQ